MYNRYIPNPDGGYRKCSVPDHAPPNPPQAPPTPPPAHPDGSKHLGDFFGHLLPSGLDTEDMIVVLLLLLMSENCDKAPNTALITLLVYLFL